MATNFKEAQDEWKDFLESTAAYVDRRFEHLIMDITPNGPGTLYGVYAPRIQLYCEIDDGVRWCQPEANSFSCQEYGTRFFQYTCRDCGRWRKTFALILVPDIKSNPKVLVAMKVGEHPPFGSHLAKRLQEMLSKGDLELYRKGLRTEREGHGIGAAAYFRRVVENQWKALVRKLRDAAEKLGTPSEKLTIFDEALKQPQFSAAVEMLKDAIPAKLLILDGRNPLTLLYKPLSTYLGWSKSSHATLQAVERSDSRTERRKMPTAGRRYSRCVERDVRQHQSSTERR